MSGAVPVATPGQVLGWRLKRNLLDGEHGVNAEAIVNRLCGVQAQVASSATLAVSIRMAEPDPAATASELAVGRLVKTWAMRGTLHLLGADELATYLSVLAPIRVWSRPAWARASGVEPVRMEALIEFVGEALRGKVLTREELVAVVVADPGFADLGEQLRSGWGSILKPMAWQGLLCYGPDRGTNVTFTSPTTLLSDWPGLKSPAEASGQVITRYLGAYGPATPRTFDAWLTRNSHKVTTLRSWFADLGERLVIVEVDGEQRFILAEHLDELLSTREPNQTCLVGGFDQLILGPGTRDAHLVPEEHRSLVSRTAGWITPALIHNGRVTGTWEMCDDTVVVQLFPGCRPPPAKQLQKAVRRIGAASGTEVRGHKLISV